MWILSPDPLPPSNANKFVVIFTKCFNNYTCFTFDAHDLVPDDRSENSVPSLTFSLVGLITESFTVCAYSAVCEQRNKIQETKKIYMSDIWKSWLFEYMYVRFLWASNLMHWLKHLWEYQNLFMEYTVRAKLLRHLLELRRYWLYPSSINAVDQSIAPITDPQMCLRVCAPIHVLVTSQFVHKIISNDRAFWRHFDILFS